MMQIGSTVPAHNLHMFQARLGVNCDGYYMKPAIKACLSKTSTNVSTTNKFTSREHLLNLENLIGTEPQSESSAQYNVLPADQSRGKGGGLLEVLNLPQIWPENKVAEEMSPRHLYRLQRLLSKNEIEYSPRNSLGSRWREYHGSNNWEGLLDPLDENLRREMVRYGEFIQAAYHCFHSDPATSGKEPPSPRQVVVPDRSYRVTKTLYATASVGLPDLIDKVAPHLEWMTQRTSCIGYVAVCEDQREISRMGRRDIVISLRGTATCLEWAENMRDLLVKIPPTTEQQQQRQQAKVQCGFLSLYKTAGVHVSSLAESVVTEIIRLTELYKGENLSISVTGHSLGAALALLVADDLSSNTSCAHQHHMPPIAVYTFGGPRVGNRAFAKKLASQHVKVLRIVNSKDIITRVPGMFASEQLDNKLRQSEKMNTVLNILDNTMPWAYAHAGTELRVDTRNSPYLKPDADVSCCHDLEAYLHLVDGFLASNCPFRSNAKRSLVKLLHEQKSNVKKLYTSKAKGLKLNLEKDIVQMSNCLPSPS